MLDWLAFLLFFFTIFPFLFTIAYLGIDMLMLFDILLIINGDIEPDNVIVVEVGFQLLCCP
jgi:hypothetical protein